MQQLCSPAPAVFVASFAAHLLLITGALHLCGSAALVICCSVALHRAVLELGVEEGEEAKVQEAAASKMIFPLLSLSSCGLVTLKIPNAQSSLHFHWHSLMVGHDADEIQWLVATINAFFCANSV